MLKVRKVQIDTFNILSFTTTVAILNMMQSKHGMLQKRGIIEVEL